MLCFIKGRYHCKTGHGCAIFSISLLTEVFFCCILFLVVRLVPEINSKEAFYS